MMQPLFHMLSACNKGQLYLLTLKEKQGFQMLMDAILSAPALKIPNYGLPFFLFCHKSGGHAKSVLTQKYGGRHRPLGYYSAQLNVVAKGATSCIRAVAACAMLKEKVANIVLDNALEIQDPHSVQELLLQARTKHLSMSRLTKYEVAILTLPNVTIRRCTTLNPATLIPEPIDDETLHLEHNCFELMDAETKPLANVQETPISEVDLELYVDGSRYYLDGKPHTGYAIVSQNEVLKDEALSPRMSAQEAELKALAEACIIAENRIENVFTDSRYAFGICHDYGPIWKSRKFIGSSGKPIKNAEAVAQLHRALEFTPKSAQKRLRETGGRMQLQKLQPCCPSQ
ncbi:uncharacterized protein [Phyllobates terribilis]|uniref:uncharacterized protein n=1 Tax=Phyllobates terribilis TaxID=111132 RepID=UPI003CCAB871